MDLLAWAKENGTEVGAVSIESSEESGLLLRATQDISPGSKIVSCSYSTMLSYLNVVSIPPTAPGAFPIEFVNNLEVDDPNIIGHFFLVQQYLLGADSFWWPYIRLLPQPDQPEKLGIPILWSKEDQQFLAGTNAEPPIKQRRQMWQQEWEKGVSLLHSYNEIEKYTYELYQWAAAIFGSRSFRASLTVPEGEITIAKLHPKNTNLILEHIRQDKFSVLLPVLDLGNHNGVNEVDWLPELNRAVFTLSNHNFIAKGNEVYNYYGDKSNSELLTAYGFTLPGSEHDVINLKVTPGHDALLLRRSQACHSSPEPNQPEKEFMFQVRSITNQPTGGAEGLRELRPFSHGLIDTMACMVATEREKTYITSHSGVCFSDNSDSKPLGPLPRNMIQVLYILRAKLQSEIARIDHHGSNLGIPLNRNQILALDYRSRQRAVLQAALTPISLCLEGLFTPKLLSQQSLAFRRPSRPETLSLESAFGWLCNQYPEVGTSITHLIAEDQEEEWPLDWTVLVEDWDHTYWIIWVFVAWILWSGDAPEKRTSKLDMLFLDRRFSEEPNSRFNTTLFAEISEEETINSTIIGILQLPQLAGIAPNWREEQHWKRLRNFASCIVHEESVRGSYKHAGKEVPQALLCIADPTTEQTLET